MTLIYVRMCIGLVLYVCLVGFLYKFQRRKGEVKEKNTRLLLKGMILMTVAMLVNVAESYYFGWNRWSVSVAEHIWDYITALAVFISMVMIYRAFFPAKETLLSKLTKEKREVVFEDEEVKLYAVTRRNGFEKKSNGIYFIFWNKTEKKVAHSWALKSINGDHREEILQKCKEHYPHLLKNEGFKNFLLS